MIYSSQRAQAIQKKDIAGQKNVYTKANSASKT